MRPTIFMFDNCFFNCCTLNISILLITHIMSQIESKKSTYLKQMGFLQTKVNKCTKRSGSQRCEPWKQCIDVWHVCCGGVECAETKEEAAGWTSAVGRKGKARGSTCASFYSQRPRWAVNQLSTVVGKDSSHNNTQYTLSTYAYISLRLQTAVVG